MAYQLHAFGWVHALADAGIASVTVSVAAQAGFPIDRLLDYRHSALCKLASGTDVTIDVDRGASFASLLGINRVVIPAGSNLSGVTNITIQQDDNAGFTSPTALQVLAGSDDLIDSSLGITSTERYLRVILTGTDAWEIPELWLTHRAAATTGIAPTWRDTPLSQRIVTSLPEREAVAILAPVRRLHTLEHRWLASSELATYDSLLAAQGAPFLFWPPDSTYPVRLVQHAADPEKQQDSPNPKGTGPVYRVALEMIEQS